MVVSSSSEIKNLYHYDAKHIWHPFTQAKIAPQPLLVKSAQNEFLNIVDQDGNEKKVIDGISSWWVNIHGHSHPYINERIKEQVDKFEHAIFAGFTHEPAIEMVKKLLPLLPKEDSSAYKKSSRVLEKVFFSDNGSTSVEVAIKMAIQFWHNQGETKRNRVIAFKDSYHGDTVGAMSTSGTALFNEPFKKIMFPVDFVDSPAIDEQGFFSSCPNGQQSKSPELKLKELEVHENRILKQVDVLISKYPDEVAAVLIEPLVQGAGGMKFHSEAFLNKLRVLCDYRGVLLIADEVFTGFGRTGSVFACEQANVVPDIICISKGITGGYLPLGLTVTTEDVYSAFHSDSRLKTFFHGHSFTGNPLSCAAAVASLELFEKERSLDKIKEINKKMKASLDCSELWRLKLVNDIRIRGAVGVIELNDPSSSAKQVTQMGNSMIQIGEKGESEQSSSDASSSSEYLAEIGPKLSKEFLRRHILLRPLGNVLYFLPPYTINEQSLDYCLQSIKDVLFMFEDS